MVAVKVLVACAEFVGSAGASVHVEQQSGRNRGTAPHHTHTTSTPIPQPVSVFGLNQLVGSRRAVTSGGWTGVQYPTYR